MERPRHAPAEVEVQQLRAGMSDGKARNHGPGHLGFGVGADQSVLGGDEWGREKSPAIATALSTEVAPARFAADLRGELVAKRRVVNQACEFPLQRSEEMRVEVG